MRCVWLAVAWAAAWLPAGSALAAGDLSKFFGVYVGVAEVEELTGGKNASRDMDIVIEPYDEEGFQIRWINVTKVDGRRDVPGVSRYVQTALFEPAEEQDFYVEVEEKNPFREREDMVPMHGHPIRWASLDGGTLHVYSFVVLEDGRYELQIYDRILTDVGLDIVFQRLVDGELVRQIKGTTARANQP